MNSVFILIAHPPVHVGMSGSFGLLQSVIHLFGGVMLISSIDTLFPILLFNWLNWRHLVLLDIVSRSLQQRFLHFQSWMLDTTRDCVLLNTQSTWLYTVAFLNI